MAGWKLTIEFRDMFFLARDPHKGVVMLLPRGKGNNRMSGHSAVLWVDDPKYSYGLRRAQVDILDGNDRRIWGTSTDRNNQKHLPSANDLLTATGGGPPKITPSLITDLPVPAALNARVVLGGGKITDLEARDRHARFEWTFEKAGAVVGYESELTDRVLFERDMPAGDGAILITHDRDDVDRITLEEGDHRLVVWNRDLRETTEDQKTIAAGKHTLQEYQHLHELFAKAQDVLPAGKYPLSTSSTVVITKPVGNDEPICGGEEGEEDPLPEPPMP